MPLGLRLSTSQLTLVSTQTGLHASSSASHVADTSRVHSYDSYRECDWAMEHVDHDETIAMNADADAVRIDDDVRVRIPQPHYSDVRHGDLADLDRENRGGVYYGDLLRHSLPALHMSSRPAFTRSAFFKPMTSQGHDNEVATLTRSPLH